MTEFPLRSILHSPDASQRLMKWAIELSQYDLLYRPKTAIKAQALADFVAEFTPSAEEEKLVSKKKESSRADKTSIEPDQPRDMWQLRVDGASNQKRAGAGVVIITPDGTLLEQAITLGFPASNNEAEYEALLAGLRLAKELSIKKLAIYSDSQLITSQASGEYMAKHPRMILYLDKVQELLKAFPTFTIQQVPRAENAHADALASLGSALDTQFRRSIPVEHLDQPSIEEAEQPDLMQIDEDPSWQDPIIDYLVNENLPEDKSETRKIKQKAARYYMRGDMLIRRSYSGPHLTCIKYPQTLEIRLPAIDSHRQWYTVRGRADHRILCEVWHQTAPVNPLIPARQWPSRGIQQDSAGLPKEKIGRRRGKMGRRAARSPMGLSHDQKEIDWRDPLFPGLWDRSNHSPTRHSPFHEH
ncbi:unnamed protein product [Prunus brigantina]